MELKQLMQLWSEKNYQAILDSFDDNELLSVQPNIIPILFEVALCAADKRKCDLLFINSLNHIDSDRDKSSGILCNALAYVLKPCTLQREEKINLLMGKIHTRELLLLFNHRIATYIATVNYQIDKYCRLQEEALKICLEIINSNSNVKYTNLFEQVFRCSRIYNSCMLVQNNINIDFSPRVNEKRYDILFSCTHDYLKLFIGNLYDLLSQYNQLHIHLVIVKRGRQKTSYSEFCKLNTRLHVYQKFVDPLIENIQLSSASTTARYEFLPHIMESTKNNLMVLDLDLTFDYINIETMIDLSQKQQDVMQSFILTYCSLIGDYQSNISAGMLYASSKHISIYFQLSFSLSQIATKDYLWGIDQAMLIKLMSANNLQPTMINYLAGVSSQSPLWSVDRQIQAIKWKTGKVRVGDLGVN